MKEIKKMLDQISDATKERTILFSKNMMLTNIIVDNCDLVALRITKKERNEIHKYVNKLIDKKDRNSVIVNASDIRFKEDLNE